MMILIQGETDEEKTQCLRKALTNTGHSASNYEWIDGEPWYCGAPTTGFFDSIGIYCTEQKPSTKANNESNHH